MPEEAMGVMMGSLFDVKRDCSVIRLRAFVASSLLLVALSGAAQAEDWRITTAGYGPARVGMTIEEASRALGVALLPMAATDEPECYYAQTKPDLPGISMMVVDGEVVRFSVYKPSDVKTRSGLGIGDTEGYVLATLGPKIEVTSHFYTGPDNHYLTLMSSDGKTDIRFETNEGKIDAFYAGFAEQVQYVEGCL